jgi:geranylgeranyl pyrophosphate synthase
VDIFSELKHIDGSKEVEALINSKFQSETPVLQEIPNYLFSLGGKRLRPLFTLMVNRLFGDSFPVPPLIEIAAGIELIHLATLLHDDIIDKSVTRRHNHSPFAKYGLSKTLLSGDFLLVRAFSLCARLDRAIINATEVACIHLTEGECDEFAIPLHEHTVASSINIARKKTAALFRLGAFSGAYFGSNNPEIHSHLSEFGESLGIAFQIIDDLLDTTGNPITTGKSRGTDIRERKPSLVNVLWLHSGSQLAVTCLLGDKPVELSQELMNLITNDLEERRVLENVREEANKYTGHAKECLAKVAEHLGSNLNNTAHTLLLQLIEFTIKRLF